VTPDLTADACADWLHVQDPVDLVVKLQYVTSASSYFYLCTGVGTSAVGVSVDFQYCDNVPGANCSAGPDRGCLR
jgi:hypothetical protein